MKSLVGDTFVDLKDLVNEIKQIFWSVTPILSTERGLVGVVTE